ncbi:MAG: hypothetical protein IJI98_02145 [Methanosphaera sp.]|nr:hypothetical protein [Methanosphaera sp.]
MKLKFKIFIISLIILILFSISFVSASQNDTLTTSDANNILTSNEDKILTESVNNNIQTKTNNKTKIDTNDGEIQTKNIKNI